MSEQPGKARRNGEWLIVLATFVCIFAMLEIGIRVMAPSLPEPNNFPHNNMEAKYSQMIDIAARGEDVAVAFVGSSPVDDGFDPEIFNRSSDGLTSFNASIPGGVSTKAWRWWTNEVILPVLKPEVVVIGVSSVDVNSGHPDRFWGPLTTSGGYRDVQSARDGGSVQRITRFLEQNVAVLRYRSVLRNPVQLIADFGADRPEALVVGPYGGKLPIPDVQYNNSEARLTGLREAFLRTFQLDGPNLDELVGLIEDLEAQSIPVLVVNMPVTEDYIRIHPGGESEYQEYVATLASISRSHGSEFVDLGQSGLPTDLFEDPFHLNADGAEILSTELARMLANDRSDATATTTD